MHCVVTPVINNVEQKDFKKLFILLSPLDLTTAMHGISVLISRFINRSERGSSPFKWFKKSKDNSSLGIPSMNLSSL